MVTAEYGGTGGKPIQEGMIVEEPDIEIGAGVSSKGMHTSLPAYSVVNSIIVNYTNFDTAMSKRIPTDSGGRRGPQSSNRDELPKEQPDRRRNGRGYRDDERPGSSAENQNPNMMPFPMGFPTMPNGMPMLPPGFTFPFMQQQNQGQDGNNMNQ